MINVIKKGKHYGSPRILSMHSGIYSKRWMVNLHSNCYYYFGNNDDKDWNKLCGWSTDVLNRNSLRVGWRCVDEKTYELVAYIHVDGKRFTIKGENWNLGKYKFNEWVEVSITHEEDLGNAVFTASVVNGVNQRIVIVPFDKCMCVGYISNLYFGGNNVAPHDMIVDIVEV
jgi:hypothetical protein